MPERIEWDEAAELKGHKPGVEDDSAGVIAH
jgi:ATP-dependent Lon protease